jgi:hypothetical protein
MSTKQRRSKFQDIFDQKDSTQQVEAEQEQPATIEEPAQVEVSPTSQVEVSTPKSRVRAATRKAPAPPLEPPRKEKPLAKSKDPEYTPVTVYVNKGIYQDVQMSLLAQGRRREVSDLTNELYQAWLEKQRKSK